MQKKKKTIKDFYNEPDYISGLKHWVYLDHNTTGFEADPSYQVEIPLSSISGPAVVGLKVGSEYIFITNIPNLRMFLTMQIQLV